MSYAAADARQQLLDTLAEATDHLAAALAALGAAYEQLDEHAGDRLEEALFRPAQAAYGRAQRTHAEFAGRYGLPARTFGAASAGHPAGGVRGQLDAAVSSVRRADDTLSTLQDSMLPVDVGDPAVRAELAEIRELVGALPSRARELTRTLGR